MGSTVAAEFLARRRGSRCADARIIQACVQDHSGPSFSSPHLHVMLHFGDETNSPWHVLNDIDLMTFRGELARVGRSIRVHLHGEKKPPDVTDKGIVAALPRLTLTAESVAQLCADGAGNCSICLSDYAAGDELVCLPCTGLHKAHWQCMSSWLGRAATCPTCRFELPTKSMPSSSRDRLLRAAKEEVHRIRRAEAAPCQAVEDDEDEDDSLQENKTAAASVESRAGQPPLSTPADAARNKRSDRRASLLTLKRGIVRWFGPRFRSLS